MIGNPVHSLRQKLTTEFPPSAPPRPADALAECKKACIAAAIVSSVINLLYLTGSFFMLEVYDRVIPSRSMPTLLALCGIVLVLYAFQGMLDMIRGRIFVRIGSLLDTRLSDRSYRAIIDLAVHQRQIDALQPSRDLDQVRQFLWSGGPVGFLDLPWIPLYLLICFAFHPWLGAAAVVGALILIALTFFTDRGAQAAAKAGNGYAAKRSQVAEASRRNAELIHAMGMQAPMGARWQTANRDYLDASGRASDVVASFGAFSKVFRTALQSMVLALGAWLVINNEATGGIMIASSILVSRALAPVEMVIGHWKGFVAARMAWSRLEMLLSAPPPQLMTLPAPTKTLTVDQISLVPPGAKAANVLDLSLTLSAGSAVGIIGRSASGKSSLARALVGIWRPAKGSVRLDNAGLDQWSPELLGQHIGYMPQESDLFEGTIAENIARFAPDATSEGVLSAAMAADVHDLVLRLPDGYNTRISEQGGMLSAGQRQRVALARALYGDPFLVVLDEPNSNLDEQGDAALTRAIVSVRARGGIAVVIAHRPAAIAACDMLLMMADGRRQMFGPKEEVLAAVTQRPQSPARHPASDDVHRIAS